jgi:hypothetical protein
MSLNRTMYDECSYRHELRRQSSALSYILDPVMYKRCKPCRHELGLVGGNEVSLATHGSLVDIENDLRGQTRPVTKCPAFKYLPRADGYIQGKEYIKPVQHPRVDTTARHLPSCQMIDYKPLPPLPKMELFRCP